MMDDLDVQMNHPAEQAVPVAEKLIVKAIHGLTFGMQPASERPERMRRRSISRPRRVSR